MDLLPVLELVKEEPTENIEVTIEHVDLTDTSTESADIFISAPSNETTVKAIPKKTKRVKMSEIQQLIKTDEPEEEEHEEPEVFEESEAEAEPTPPPSPKKKVKKKATEKQLAHLKRIRLLAAEKKKANKLERLAAETKVKETIKQRRENKKKQKDEYTDDFRERMSIATDQELQILKVEKEAAAYRAFLNNMKTYKAHKQEYKPAPAPPPAPPPVRAPPPRPKPSAPINVVPENPFSCAFDW